MSAKFCVGTNCDMQSYPHVFFLSYFCLFIYLFIYDSTARVHKKVSIYLIFIKFEQNTYDKKAKNARTTISLRHTEIVTLVQNIFEMRQLLSYVGFHSSNPEHKWLSFLVSPVVKVRGLWGLSPPARSHLRPCNSMSPHPLIESIKCYFMPK